MQQPDCLSETSKETRGFPPLPYDKFGFDLTVNGL